MEVVMNLEISVDKLYETGWHAVSSDSGLERLPDGRAYPSVLATRQIFAAAGYDLAIRYVQLFDCYRAVWTDSSGTALGAVVGSDEREAAVYALAQMRRGQISVATNRP
jgi:hypothetical protein